MWRTAKQLSTVVSVVDGDVCAPEKKDEASAQAIENLP
jgi:hypothetical protein